GVVLGGGYTHIINNTFSGTGVLIPGGSGMLLENNSLANVGVSSLIGSIYIGGYESRNNTIRNNTIYGCTGYSGIYIAGMTDNRISDNIISNNTRGIYIGGNDNKIENNSIYGNTYGVYFESSKNSTLENTSIWNSGAYELYLTSSSNVSVINCSFNSSKAGYGDANSNITVWWYLIVNSTNRLGSVLGSVNISAVNNASATYFSALTNASGQIAKRLIPQYFEKQAGRTSYAPYNITAMKSSYGENTTQIFMNASLELNIVVPDSYAPNVSITYPSADANVSNSFRVNATITDGGEGVNASLVYVWFTGAEGANVTPWIVMSNVTNSSFNKSVNLALYNVADGWLNATINASDVAGNVNASELVQIRKDGAAPAVTNANVSPLSVSTGGGFVINASVTEAMNSISSVYAYVEWSAGDAWVEMSEYDGAGNYTCNFTNTTRAGVYSITIFANDTLGNSNNSESIAGTVVAVGGGTPGDEARYLWLTSTGECANEGVFIRVRDAYQNIVSAEIRVLYKTVDGWTLAYSERGDYVKYVPARAGVYEISASQLGYVPASKTLAVRDCAAPVEEEPEEGNTEAGGEVKLVSASAQQTSCTGAELACESVFAYEGKGRMRIELPASYTEGTEGVVDSAGNALAFTREGRIITVESAGEFRVKIDVAGIEVSKREEKNNELVVSISNENEAVVVDKLEIGGVNASREIARVVYVPEGGEPVEITAYEVVGETLIINQQIEVRYAPASNRVIVEYMCASDDECGSKFCLSGKCIECIADEQCGADGVCLDNLCADAAQAGEKNAAKNGSLLTPTSAEEQEKKRAEAEALFVGGGVLLFLAVLAFAIGTKKKENLAVCIVALALPLLAGYFAGVLIGSTLAVVEVLFLLIYKKEQLHLG
ncbi:MAG: right-handed parallel beta-helix repeat-containing protein, partial [Candidatus Micrarchaeota archaeon]